MPDPEVIARRLARARDATKATQEKFEHHLDVAYGRAERHRYDLYLPKGDPAGPTLVFLHGGGFRVGSRADCGYDGTVYLELGCIFASMGYRLIDEARFPLCAEDVEEGLVHLQDNISRRGGDPERVYLAGASSGAMLAAQAGFRPEGALPPDLVRGLVLISGFYDFSSRPDELVDRSSPRYVDDLCKSMAIVPRHVITAAGDSDMPRYLADSERMAGTVIAKGGRAEHFLVTSADHFESTRTFITPDADVARATARMMGITR
jgi:acetyl esterase/lipase